MALDFRRKRKLLIIHGVQRGTNQDLTQHKVIEKNVEAQLKGFGVPFETDIFKYEDINDRAFRVVRKALAALTGNVIDGWVVSQAVDLVSDVALALNEGPTYRRIKRELSSRILESYEKEQPLFLVAHSLGSIYAFDVINDLIREDDYFQGAGIETRPVLGLVTLGSPISLDLFERDWQDMASLVPAGQPVTNDFPLLPWRNYFDPTDPIVSGSIVGLPWDEEKFERKFPDKVELGWDIRARKVITNQAHLAAHTAYWQDANVGLGLRQILARS